MWEEEETEDGGRQTEGGVGGVGRRGRGRRRSRRSGEETEGE